jgi:D-glycero-D-manno-heptose 1,7-bisphosphate phosphatase
MTSARRAAVFLDRDGVINLDNGYTHRPDELVVLPGVVEELRRLHSLGYLLVVVTNQAGIARGYYTERDYETFMTYLRSELASRDVVVDVAYHCPHHPEGSVPQYAIKCDCRKPKPGMLLAAMRDYGIQAAESWLVGDKLSDVQAGVAAGIPQAQCLLVDSNAGLAPVAGVIGTRGYGHGEQEIRYSN